MNKQKHPTKPPHQQKHFLKKSLLHKGLLLGLPVENSALNSSEKPSNIYVGQSKIYLKHDYILL